MASGSDATIGKKTRGATSCSESGRSTEEQALREVALPIASIRYGELTTLHFDPIPDSAGITLYLELQAPETTHNSALGARIDPNPEAEPTGEFTRGGNQESADLAFVLSRKTGQWSRLITTLRADAGLRILASHASMAGVFFTIMAYVLQTASRRRRKAFLTEALVVGSLLVALLGVRLSLAQEVQAVPPGDPYNFAFILERLLEGRNPYENEKRLPGFPILLLCSCVRTCS